MYIKLFTFLLFIFFQITTTFAQHNIIPIPVSYTSTNEVFVFDNQLSFDIKTTNAETIQYIEQFQNYLSAKGISIADKPIDKSIHISLYKILYLNLEKKVTRLK